MRVEGMRVTRQSDSCQAPQRCNARASYDVLPALRPHATGLCYRLHSCTRTPINEAISPLLAATTSSLLTPGSRCPRAQAPEPRSSLVIRSWLGTAQLCSLSFHDNERRKGKIRSACLVKECATMPSTAARAAFAARTDTWVTRFRVVLLYRRGAQLMTPSKNDRNRLARSRLHS